MNTTSSFREWLESVKAIGPMVHARIGNAQCPSDHATLVIVAPGGKTKETWFVHEDHVNKIPRFLHKDTSDLFPVLDFSEVRYSQFHAMFHKRRPS